MKHMVFVYGSLKKSFGNNRLLYNSKYIGEAVTLSSNFNMRSCGAFPAVVSRGKNSISGELYEVDDKTLTSIDILESNGRFYNRSLVQVTTVSQPALKEFTAWIYLLQNDYGMFCEDDYGRYKIVKDKYNCLTWQHKLK